MDDLGLDELTDDQLVELALVVAREAARRNPALQAAMRESLEEERLKLEAQARGAAQARAAARRRAEEIASRAVQEVEDRKLSSQRNAALSRYLEQAADIISRDVRTVTLVYKPRCTQGRAAGGAELLVNAGTAGELARWHLVDYADKAQHVWTTPALESRKLELIAWGKEACAAARALKIDRTTTIFGGSL